MRQKQVICDGDFSLILFMLQSINIEHNLHIKEEICSLCRHHIPTGALFAAVVLGRTQYMQVHIAACIYVCVSVQVSPHGKHQVPS